MAAESGFRESVESDGPARRRAIGGSRNARNFAQPVHRFSQGQRENSIDDVLGHDYLHARLNREA
jgi:hypothetical protein